MTPDQTVESHPHRFAAAGARFRKTLDEVADDRGARRPMEERDFLYGERATKHGLADSGNPFRFGLVAEFTFEVDTRSLVRKTGWHVRFGERPCSEARRQRRPVSTSSNLSNLGVCARIW